MPPLPAHPAPGDGAEPLLRIEDLTLSRGRRIVLDGVSFTLGAGESLALVGESGAGKSTVAMVLMGLLRPPEVGLSGRISFDGTADLVAAPEKQWRTLRGRRIAMIFQDAGAALDPCYTVGRQIEEPLRRLLGLSPTAARARAVELLQNVGLNDAEARLSAFPHQLSGGMQQRVMIAIALASDPALLLADEPTSALDVTIQAQIVRLILEQTRRRKASCIFVLHNLALASQCCDSIVILYAGQVMEYGACEAVLRRPMHPYTRVLQSCVLDIDTGELAAPQGTAPSLSAMPAGCRFAPRCPRATARCTAERPPLAPLDGRLVACWNPR